MTRPYDIISFDCYGTLIDWEGGIGAAFRQAAAGAGVAIDQQKLLQAYAEIEPAVQAEPFRGYRAVLAETARRVAARFGWSLDEEGARFLPDSLEDWQPFPDTNAALRRLAGAGYRLGILSNVDDDLLAGSRRRLSVDFELLITAQQVQSYKPGHAHFLTARARIGADPWLHAAQSYFHDVIPARALGIPIAWVNRKGERAADGGAADIEVRTLAELAERLAPAST